MTPFYPGKARACLRLLGKRIRARTDGEFDLREVPLPMKGRRARRWPVAAARDICEARARGARRSVETGRHLEGGEEVRRHDVECFPAASGAHPNPPTTSSRGRGRRRTTTAFRPCGRCARSHSSRRRGNASLVATTSCRAPSRRGSRTAFSMARRRCASSRMRTGVRAIARLKTGEIPRVRGGPVDSHHPVSRAARHRHRARVLGGEAQVSSRS